MRLHNTIATRYVGTASLIKLKTPQEERTLLKNVRKEEKERVYRFSSDQQSVYQAGACSYVNFGGHGSGEASTISTQNVTDSLVGKTLLMQANIERDANIFVKDSESHWQIICVWQKGADALFKQYRALEKTLPKGANLETMVLTKEELLKKFMVKEEGLETTEQINAICQNSSYLMPNTRVHLYIDETWITVPKMFEAHVTLVRVTNRFCKHKFCNHSKCSFRRTQMRWWATSPL